jgi:hypothetical protein
VTEQTWINRVKDPKVVTPIDVMNPTISKAWSVGFTTGGGAGFGDSAQIVTTGGPLPETPHYGGGSSGATVVVSASVGYGMPGIGSDKVQVAPGETVAVSLWGWASVDATANLRVTAWDIDENYISDQFFGDPTSLPASTWAKRAATYVVPDGVAGVSFHMEFIPNTPSAVQVRGSAATAVPSVDGLDYTGPYIDGDLTDLPGVAVYAWLGTPDDSESSLTLTYEELAAALSAPAQGVPIASPSGRTFKTVQLTNYSVSEESTPVTPSDGSGSAGSMTLLTTENEDTPYLQNIPIDLVDPSQGTTRGTIRLPSSNNGDATLIADSRLALLVVNRVAAPFTGTLANALRYYLELCDITDDIVTEDSLTGISVKFAGWSGNVWTEIKKICTVFGIEAALVSNNIVFRPIRQRDAETYRDSSRGWTLDTSQQARNVEVYQYQTSQITNGLVYPQGGWNSDVKVMSAAAGAVVEQTFEIDGSVIAINQPSYMEGIAPGYSATSVYSVSGNDNLPITAAQWAVMGGSLTVRISEDSRSLIVRFQAPAEERFAPYRVGVPDGESFFSTLRIVGDALLWNKVLHTYPTAVDPDRVSQEVGATVDMPYIQTDKQLLDAVMNELRQWGGTRRTVSVGARGINRLGDSGSYSYAELEDFDLWWDGQFPGSDLGDFDTEAPGIYGSSPTFEDFDAWWVAEVQDEFANQAFGNIGGARVREPANVTRIRTATITPDGISYSASEDSILEDLDEVWTEEVPGGERTNAIPNPSPQLSATGWAENVFPAGARVAGEGVDGGYGYRVTATGDITATNAGPHVGRSTNNDVPVVPGATVYPSLYAKANANHNASLLVAWWTAAGALVSMYMDANVTALVANAAHVRLIGSRVEAPATAARMTVRVVNPNAATDPWIGTRTNLFVNPNAVNGTTSFAVIAAGVTALSQVSGAAFGTLYAARSTRLTTAAGGVRMTLGTALAANATYTARFKVRANTDITDTGSGTNSTFQVRATSGTGAVKLTLGNLVAGVVKDVTVVFTMGATATDAAAGILVRTDSGTGGNAINDWVELTLVSIEAGDTSASPVGFFAGDSTIAGRTAAWTGTVNNSTSTLSGDAITIDRAHIIGGDYFDGAVRPAGFDSHWLGGAYASPSVLTALTHTLGEFDPEWEGYTMGDFDAAPLREVTLAW